MQTERNLMFMRAYRPIVLHLIKFPSNIDTIVEDFNSDSKMVSNSPVGITIYDLLFSCPPFLLFLPLLPFIAHKNMRLLENIFTANSFREQTIHWTLFQAALPTDRSCTIHSTRSLADQIEIHVVFLGNGFFRPRLKCCLAKFKFFKIWSYPT